MFETFIGHKEIWILFSSLCFVTNQLTTGAKYQDERKRLEDIKDDLRSIIVPVKSRKKDDNTEQ
jgi:hypothetical protein